MTDARLILRALRDLGLAGWFGGALMGAASVNGAARAAGQTAESVRFANEAWRRWSPLNLAAVAACVVGEAGLSAVRLRERGRRELAAVGVEAGLTAAALTASTVARRLGRELEQGPWDAPGPGERRASVRLARVQWVVPALTGLALVSSRRPELEPSRYGLRTGVRDALDRSLRTARRASSRGRELLPA